MASSGDLHRLDVHACSGWIARSRAWTMVLALGAAIALAGAARGQDLTPTERDELYKQLDREAAALEARQNVLKTVVRLVSPTVVHIQWKSGGRYSRQSGRTREVEEAGSGVIVRLKDRFFVLTNWHVVRDAPLQSIEINLIDGRQLAATGVWKDPATDVAIIASDQTELIAARLGNSEAIEIGDFVLAVGSPFGLNHSVTYGIISAKGRRQLELGDEGLKFQDFLQTDAAINPGNSGGPLINLRGEVIGINTAIASNSGGNEGCGFAIPINMVMAVAKQLVEQGKVVRAFLGVTLDKQFNAAAATKLGLMRPRGARIIRVTPGSAADLAHLQVDDVVLEFNHTRIEDDLHLVNVVSLTEVGTEVPVMVFRGGKEVVLMVKVGDRSQYEQTGDATPLSEPRGGSDLSLDTPAPAEEDEKDDDNEAWDIAVLGLTVVDLTPQVARQMHGSDAEEGLLVTEVEPRGPSANNVLPGDIIDRIEETPMQSIDDLERALSQSELTSGINLRLARRHGDRLSHESVRISPRISDP